MGKLKGIQTGDTIALNWKGIGYDAIDYDRFNITQDGTGVIKQCRLMHQYMPIGMKTFAYVPGSHIEMEFSAKILGKDYYDGINLDTIDKVCNVLSTASEVDISAASLLNNSVVRKFDNTFNMKFDEPIGEYIKALEYGAIGGSKFNIREYGDESVVFEKQTIQKQRLLFYNKSVELQLPDNKAFRKLIGEDAILQFDGILRAELNVAQYRKLRDHYTTKKQGGVSLNEILICKENVIEKNFANFVNIRESKNLLFTIDEMDNQLSFRDIAEKEFIKTLMNKAKGDGKKVKKIIKEKGNYKKDIPKKLTHYVNEIQKIWEDINVYGNVPQATKRGYADMFMEVNEKIKQL
jgi:hypothetical protein